MPFGWKEERLSEAWRGGGIMTGEEGDMSEIGGDEWVRSGGGGGGADGVKNPTCRIFGSLTIFDARLGSIKGGTLCLH